MTTTSDKGFGVLRAEEGRSLRAYKDAVGVWTIGFGNTNADASVLGFKIEAGKTITAQQAENLLQIAVRNRYEPDVNKRLPNAPQNVYDMSIDFHYNTGAINKATWVKDYLAGRGAKAILLWNKGGGRVLKGLDRRRHRELTCIETGDYGPISVPAELILDASGKEIGATAGTPTTALPQGRPAGMIGPGSTGPEVEDLQRTLTESGFVCPIDGNYGDADGPTATQVKAFQSTHAQLNVDGIAGPATRAALQRMSDARAKTQKAGATVTVAAPTVVVDQTTHAAPFLPTWSIALMGATFVVVCAYVAWQYRDELRAHLAARGWLKI